jgi:tetratricopeptide (TPR) repeat protein
MKALERTCKVFPEGMPWLLEHIGPQLGAVGQWDKMAKLFSGLPRRVRQSERVLQWRLECALELNQGHHLLREVEAFLAQHEAPELRALYGQLKYRLGDPEASLRETERAVKAWESVRTLYYYGVALYARDVKASKEVLMKGLRLAERQGNFFWAAKSATVLSAHLCVLGEYQAAAQWAEWAVRAIDREGIVNSHLCSRAVNEWAFGRLMAGETIGAEARLRETIRLNTDQDANIFVMGTLADVLLASGRALEAATYYRQLWENQSDRNGIAARTDLFVRCLIELGQLDEAQAVAEQSIKLSEENPLVFNRRAKLALGMVLALRAPGRAIQVLEGVFRELKEPLLAWRYVQAGLYLARAYQSLGDLLMAREVIEELRPHLDSIGATGLYYLCGPADLFHDIVGWIRGGLPRLELRLLGRPEVRLDGKLLNLGHRSQEILALLALNLEGLNLDQLAVALYGDGADKAKAKMNLYALKKQVSIEGYPYRLGLSVWADFLEVPRLVREGKLREAIGLAKGPLLPDSEAPPLVEQRDYLNELLRQAALQDEDLEARLVLAERAQDDLEMWEASLSVMPSHDPRRLSAAAKAGTLVANY